MCGYIFSFAPPLLSKTFFQCWYLFFLVTSSHYPLTARLRFCFTWKIFYLSKELLFLILSSGLWFFELFKILKNCLWIFRVCVYVRPNKRPLGEKLRRVVTLIFLIFCRNTLWLPQNVVATTKWTTARCGNIRVPQRGCQNKRSVCLWERGSVRRRVKKAGGYGGREAMIRFKKNW